MHVENGGVNPSNSGVGYELTEHTATPREAPPPYSPSEPTPVVVTSQPTAQQTFILQVPLKSNPVYYTCPKCMERVYTKVKHVNSRKTHLLAGFICGCTTWFLMCCLGLIPYVVKTFKKSEHYCPNCDTLLGSYSKI